MWIKALNSVSYSLNTLRIWEQIIHLLCRLWILMKFSFIKTYSDASQLIKTKIRIFRLSIWRVIDIIIRFLIICFFCIDNSWTTQLNNVRKTSFKLSADNLNTYFLDSDDQTWNYWTLLLIWNKSECNLVQIQVFFLITVLRNKTVKCVTMRAEDTEQWNLKNLILQRSMMNSCFIWCFINLNLNWVKLQTI